MNERRMQFRVGVVVFATTIIGALLATLNGPLPTGWAPWGRKTYQVEIILPEAPGVGPNTPVRKNGLLIGRVASIEDKETGVVVRANIDQGRTLYPEYEPHVRTSVLGDATIDFITRPLAVGSQPVTDGATFQGRVDPNPFDALTELADLKGDLASTIRSLGEAGDEVANLARRVDEAFGTETEEGRVKRLVDKTEVAMDQFARTMTSVNEILGGEAVDDQQLRQRIRQGLNELPGAVQDARVTMRDFRVVLESAEKNFRNLEGFTEPLGQKGDQIAGSIVEAVDGLDKLVEEFTVLTQALNNREGTIGQLIHNPQLYENFNRLIYNANQVVLQVSDLTLRLRPVVNDARVFMDKIAREPGRVIIGGLNPSPLK